MEILQTIWNSLTTENMELINIISIPLIFIEAILSTLLFTYILYITSSTRTKIAYILTISLLTFITRYFILVPFGIAINLILIPIFISLFFKVSWLKAIVSEIFPVIIIVTFETIISCVFYNLFSTTLENSYSIPLHRLIIAMSIYLFVFIFYLTFKKLKLNITIFDNFDKKTKRILAVNFSFGILAMLIQSYLISFYTDRFSILVTFFSILTLLAFFILSIYNLTRSTKIAIINRDLEIEKTYNKTLTLLHDNIRGFKHDFNNIVQAIGGYVVTNDMSGLKKYYSQLLEDCQKCNNLTALSPDAINNPPIYAILADKYHIADEKGIKVNLEIFLDLNTLNIKIYEFTRILGILLDNAIEAANLCDEKVINIRMQKAKNVQLLIIENTYTNKDVDVNKIFEKDFSTKKVKSGLGLWEVKQYLNKSKNLNLYTNKDDKFFKQQFEIYPN